MELLSLLGSFIGIFLFGAISPAINAQPPVEAPIEIAAPATAPTETTEMDEVALAKCLTAKGAVMYGASWCPHCQNQKSLFGAGKQFVPYQECDANSPGGDMAKCQAAGVTAYPTWKFASGETSVGEQSLSELAAKAQCL